jgi:intracellular sulfur oxidation DsrE/DsrF family protein
MEMFRSDSKVAGGLKEAEASGIALRACGNTMKSRKMTDKDLVPGIKVVNSGVVEIIQKQKEGWGYLMP